MTIRPAALIVLGLSFAAWAGCGRKGPLELPPGREPMPAEGLKAVAEGGAVRLTWANPAKTVAGKPLEAVGAVEIMIFEKDPPAAGAAPGPEAVQANARRVARLEAAEAAAGSYLFTPPPGGPGSLAFTVRVFDRKGRASAFSSPAVAVLTRPPDVLPEREGA